MAATPPCSCGNSSPSWEEFIKGEHCLKCTVWEHRLKKKLTEPQSDTPPVKPRARAEHKNTDSLSCKFRGPQTGRNVPCQTCNKVVSLPVFHCEKFGECTLRKLPNPDVKPEIGERIMTCLVCRVRVEKTESTLDTHERT